MPEFPDYAQLANLQMLEDLYAKFLEDPESVDLSWKNFFEGVQFGSYLAKRAAPAPSGSSELRIYDLVQAYRRYGHLMAHFNPLEEPKAARELNLEKLGFFSAEMNQSFPSLGFCSEKEATLSQILAALQQIYCGPIGFEYMDLGNPELEQWIQKRIEPKLLPDISLEDKHLLLEYLYKSEGFETFLHSKYVGQTRFSLEGAETLIPLLAEIIDYLGEHGVSGALIGMAHRGRLNVLTNILNKSLETILAEFEDDTTLSFAGNDDLRYHLGFTGEFLTRTHKKVTVEMPANPSHLESVNPILIGQTFARQFLQKSNTVPILIHGDASIAGQGVIYETLQLMRLPSYSVGGTLHIVVNNQIGYTTLPKEGRSTRYCTDIAKTFGCPVFHVNAEDPESCLFAAKLAVEIRQKFNIDVFIDLLGYRKYGHNEGDEPSFTQPLQYDLIRSKKSIHKIYLEKLLSEGKLEQKLAETLEIQLKDRMQNALAKVQGASLKAEERLLSKEDPFAPCATQVDERRLQGVTDLFCKVPAQFTIHPKLQKWLEMRERSLQQGIDWATAEALAVGTLLEDKISIRLAGQDSERGTFNQRHMVWIDSKTAQSYCPFSQYPTPCQIVNSPLSEYACMGFEYGYSLNAPQGLTLWEAQYGDFNNGAQIVIDQYLVSGEQKWDTPSNLTLLLPHAYEGSGPEHSSARLERFLQLCACQNIQVVYPSTPAQYFHLLRRQALKKKPLIVMTPKSLLRLPACVSKLSDLTQGKFAEILDDPSPPASPKRLVFCSGKVYYDLLAARKDATVIVRIEQLYPLHVEKLKQILEKYRSLSEVVWAQEEPENMGAWRFIRPYLQELTKLRYIGREANATTSTGSNKKHKQDQQALVKQILGAS